MIVIALATYNGQRYLAEQIQSIRRQTFEHWTLLVSDDGSNDGTPQMLRRFAASDHRIQVLPPLESRRGTRMNFGRLIEHALARGARYVAFADQDDVWLPNKMETQLRRMQALENDAPQRHPILIHSDATVVDEALNPIAASHHQFVRSKACRDSRTNLLATLLLHAYVQGCTIMMNRPLLDFVVPLPAAAVSHDWWCSLCAAAIGTIDYIPEPTLQYRQHGNNCIGARHGGLLSIAKRVIRDRHYWRHGMTTFANSLRQSSAISGRLRERGLGDSPLGALVEDYCRIMHGEGTRLGRIWELRKRRIPDVDWLRKLVSYTRVMLLPESIRLQLPAIQNATRAEEESQSTGVAVSVPDSLTLSMPVSVNGGID